MNEYEELNRAWDELVEEVYKALHIEWLVKELGKWLIIVSGIWKRK